ncbi:MAG: GTP-binding protein [Promethearchaeota archaeon]|nr:MAG: GTP-binding protein [Candidatus Lokiarchaeota archaeon]
MLNRYVEGRFKHGSKMTIGVDILQKLFTLNDGLKVSLQLWDFGGQQHFRFFMDSFIRGANGGFLMFDLTNMKSFVNLEEWLKLFRKENPALPIVLLGAKLDLEELIVVSDEMANETKEKFNIGDYLKISSKTGYNVEEAFHVLVHEIRKYNNDLSRSNELVSNNINPIS